MCGFVNIVDEATINRFDSADEGLMFKTSAIESLYDGQITFSIMLIKPNILFYSPT